MRALRPGSFVLEVRRRNQRRLSNRGDNQRGIPCHEGGATAACRRKTAIGLRRRPSCLVRKVISGWKFAARQPENPERVSETRRTLVAGHALHREALAGAGRDIPAPPSGVRQEVAHRALAAQRNRRFEGGFTRNRRTRVHRAGTVRAIPAAPAVVGQLEFVHVPAPPMDGVSLMDLLTGRQADLDLEAYSESEYPVRLGWSPLAAAQGSIQADRRAPRRVLRPRTRPVRGAQPL
jgi:hypothetical protein